MRHTKKTRVRRSRQKRNNAITSTIFSVLVVEYCVRDTFNIDVAQLEFRRSRVAGETIEETLDTLLSTNTDASDFMQRIWLQLASGIIFSMLCRI